MRAWYTSRDQESSRALKTELAAQAQAGSRTRAGAEALSAASGCFEHNIEHMNDAVFAAMSFPIGSGVTEVACKALFKMRLCGSSIKWTRSGTHAVLSLRAVLLSSRLNSQ